MACESSSGRLKAFEAVPIETPAAAATSRSVVLRARGVSAAPLGPGGSFPLAIGRQDRMFDIESVQVSLDKTWLNRFKGDLMINLAAAAILVRDLTEQHLDGAGASAPAGRSRQAPRTDRTAPAPSGRQPGPAPSQPSGPRRRVPRSA